MKKLLAAVTLVLLLTIGILIYFVPDLLSFSILTIMLLIIIWGYWFGILRTVLFFKGFRFAQQTISNAQNVQADTVWLVIQQSDTLFGQKDLDQLFSVYQRKINEQERQGQILSDIEEYINEDSLALRSWQGIVHQIPGTLTALGLLGTFVGLILGISYISFSSVEATITSIELLLNGIRTAFYTSIAGVILSILFNMLFRFTWNTMLRELGMFCEAFHQAALPTAEEQMRARNLQDAQEVLKRLDRLPNDAGFSMAAATVHNTLAPENEQKLMQEIRTGLKQGEFSFQLRPICQLSNTRIIGAEMILCWTHGSIGVVSPSAYLPLIEQNGYVATINKTVWEDACKAIRKWLDAGIRPVPISVNISKTDILATDIVQFFSDIVRKYRIPPQYLVLEISQNAYLQCDMVVRDAVTQLRQMGFRTLVDRFDGNFVQLDIADRLETDGLKMDIRFLRSENEKFGEMLESVFEQARRLQYPVSVCGLETAEQLAILRKVGCTEGQGDYLYKRMNIDDFENLIKLQ